MEKRIKRKPSIGDIVEIQIPKGFAYAQYTHKHPLDGELIRILPGIFDLPLESYKKCAAAKELYFVFFPLAAAISKGLVKIVSNEMIPQDAREFPLMRRRGGISADGKVLNWWIWDGTKQWRVDKLDEEQKALPPAGIWNYKLLIERLVEGWTPLEDFATE